MSLAANIAPELPLLRRFSRALNGSQSAGDAYVAAMLEALIQDPKSLNEKLGLRVALYQMFCCMWESTSLNMKQASGSEKDTVLGAAPAQRIQAQLSCIAPKAREAFLLLAVEGFRAADIANILQVSKSEVEDLVDQASQVIVGEVTASVLIIEDDVMIALDLRNIIESIGHRVIGFARTHAEAAAVAIKFKPGLILADIQLADDSSGLDAVNDILTSFHPQVVFITAFPERLLTGARAEPTFLIMKPFTPEMVKAVVGQALFFGTANRVAA